jgi:hypothetical protein
MFFCEHPKSIYGATQLGSFGCSKTCDEVPVIAQFVAKSNGYEVEGQTGITGTYPTQCHHDGEVLSL